MVEDEDERSKIRSAALFVQGSAYELPELAIERNIGLDQRNNVENVRPDPIHRQAMQRLTTDPESI